MVEPKYLATQLSGPVVGLYEFAQNDGAGGVNRFWFAAARTNNTPGTKTCNFYQNVASAWSVVASVGTLADAPMAVTHENNFFLSDGATNFLFNGTIWVKDGFALPFNGPALNIQNGASTALFGLVDGVHYVKATYFPGTSGENGECTLNPSSPVASNGGPQYNNSILFNPPQYNGTRNPNVHPMKWAVLNADGTINSYVNVVIGETNANFQMAVEGKLIFPAPGIYTIALQHDDGAFLAFGTGAVSGAAIVLLSGPRVNVWQNHPQQNPTYNVIGGSNLNAPSGGWNDTFQIQVLAADTYGFEIDYRSWQNEEELLMYVNGSTPLPAASSNPGLINANVGKYYWYTNADETVGVKHESSSSDISGGSSSPIIAGPLTGAKVVVYQQPGLFSSSTATTLVTGSASADIPGPTSPTLSSRMAGLQLWINGTVIGTIASVSGINITLTANALATKTNGRAVIADARSTHWHVYASESDGSKIGQYLATVPVTQDLNATPYTDNSVFIDNVTNTYLPIFRPVRNDKPPASKLLEVHKIRQWRRRESSPNFFNCTANEEVLAGNNGDAGQSMPGADANTISDMVNEFPYPDQSSRIRALVSHMDALFLFSEKNSYPLYGESVDDFAIAQHTAFTLGIAGRFAGKSTPFGLAFVSYDKKALLYPSSTYSTKIAEVMDTTSQLGEIGKPMRNKLFTIDSSRLDEVVSVFYYHGIRSWWVLSFSDVTPAQQSYVYDFQTQKWFQLQRGFGALAVFEVAEGKRVLIGGSSDGFVYVIDDQTGTYSQSGTYPAATYRTALINFGSEMPHVFRYLEVEFSNTLMAADTTITYWLDPNDVDNPGVGKIMHLKPALGAGRYRAFTEGGATCQRMLLEIKTKASVNNGVLRGIKLAADPAGALLPNAGAGGNG